MFTFWNCCWNVKMVIHGMTTCVITQHVIFPMWVAKLTHPWLLSLLVHGVCYALRAATMLICDWCSRRRHMGCLMPPLKKILVKKWFCF
jgi:hypothetical protein